MYSATSRAKKIVAPIVGLVFFFGPHFSVDAASDLCSEEGIVPLSVRIAGPDEISLAAGESIVLPMTITNRAPVTVARGMLYGALFPVSTEVGRPIDVVALGAVPRLLPGEETLAEVQWRASAHLPAGEYVIGVIFEPADEQAAQVKAFTGINIVGSLEVSVHGEGQAATISALTADGAAIRDQQLSLETVALPPRFALRTSNPATDEVLRGSVTWRLYQGTVPLSQALLTTQTEEVKHVPGGTREYQFTPTLSTDYDEYLLVAEVTLSNGDRSLAPVVLTTSGHGYASIPPQVSFLFTDNESLSACFVLGNGVAYQSLPGATPVTATLSQGDPLRHFGTEDFMRPDTTNVVSGSVSIPLSLVTAGTLTATAYIGETEIMKTAITLACDELRCGAESRDNRWFVSLFAIVCALVLVVAAVRLRNRRRALQRQMLLEENLDDQGSL